jgi:SAM-dependent methyltransferase
MTIPQKISAKTCIDQIDLHDGIIRIHGWSGSIDAGAVRGFRASVSATNLPIVACELGLPSPDVKQVFPLLASGERCRFNLALELPQEATDQFGEHPLLSLVPLFESGPGQLIRQPLAPGLPDPPKEFTEFVGGAFRSVGMEFLDHFIDLGRLRPSDHVLDVGCGVGRMTYGLVHYLNRDARYIGFDFEPKMIKWAQDEITKRHPNFAFEYAPIYNSYYNPKGTIAPDQYVFPYPPASFDFVFLTSVFTHMPATQVRHYMSEIRKVLKPGGRALITCFMLNGESKPLIAAGKSSRDLSHPSGESMVASLSRPDEAVGFEESTFRKWLEEHDLRVETIAYGSWCNRANALSYQDLVVIQG